MKYYKVIITSLSLLIGLLLLSLIFFVIIRIYYVSDEEEEEKMKEISTESLQRAKRIAEERKDHIQQIKDKHLETS